MYNIRTLFFADIKTYNKQIINIISLLIVVITCAVTTSLFLPYQSLWVDETTQLSGLSLNPIEVCKWLLGDDANRFGVPPDRMPPLSYWTGWIWSKFFGLTETSMRAFGIMCTTISSVFIFLAARNAFGLASALLAGILFGISPNVIDISVEIRAYPLFLMLASGAYYAQTKIIEKNNTLSYCLLSFFCISAIYTHFYGIIMSGSLLLSLLITTIIIKRPIYPVILIGIIILVSFIGITPFVIAAINVTGNSSVEINKFYSIIRLAYRLIAHASIQTNVLCLIICLISACILIIFGCYNPKKGKITSTTITLALIFGFIIVSIANFIFSGFISTEITYNIWMLPGICLLISSAIHISNSKARMISIIASILYIIVTFYSTIQFIVNATKFSNSPFKAINSIIDEYDRENLSIIFDTNSTGWGALYFPIVYKYNHNIKIYLATLSGNNNVILSLCPDLVKKISIDDVKSKNIIIIRTEMQSSQMIINQIKYGDMLLDAGQCKLYLTNSKDWRMEVEKQFVTMVSANLTVIKNIR